MTEVSNLNDLNYLYSLALSHVVSKAISLAVEIKLDKNLSDEPLPIDTLAEKFNFSSAATFRFLRLLDTYEIVELLGDKRVKAGKLLNYLDRLRSPHILDSYNFIDNLKYSLANNEECYSKTFGKNFYTNLLDTPNKLMDFKKWCAESAKDWLPSIFSIYDFSKFDTVVDIGGGEGYFLASILAKSATQKGILLDLPAIVEQAHTVFKQYGVSDRVESIGGDFFVAIPSGGNVYTICRTLLNWNDNDALTIINNCYKVMKKNSTLLIIDFLIPDKQHFQYKIGVLSDINLLACVNSTNRTAEEWQKLIAQSDFTFKKMYITDEKTVPQPVLPMFVLEAVAS